VGDWKYIDNELPDNLSEERKKRIKFPLELQLYNLSEDISESANLIENNPEIVNKLTRELERIRNQESSR
jgi:hypothetical protein